LPYFFETTRFGGYFHARRSAAEERKLIMALTIIAVALGFLGVFSTFVTALLFGTS
jgi:hypothetical protein